MGRVKQPVKAELVPRPTTYNLFQRSHAIQLSQETGLGDIYIAIITYLVVSRVSGNGFVRLATAMCRFQFAGGVPVFVAN